MSRTSRFLLERNRDLARAAFGPWDEDNRETFDEYVERTCDDEAKAAGLTPFIVGGVAVAALGGAVGLNGKQRACAAAIAVALFLGI